MKRTIKLLTLALMLATILTLTGCPGPVNNYIEPPVWDDGIVTTEPTCTEEGVKTYTCSNGETRTETIPALGHDMGEWEITKNPTCTEKGGKTRKCSRCGETKTVEIDALGHDWEEITTDKTKAATCTEDGIAVYKCKTCGAIEERTTNKLGHNFGEWTVTTAATCTADGEETRTCKREGCKHFETRTIKAHHSWGDWTVAKEATCTEKGSKKHTCTRCGAEETVEIDALGHDYQGGYCEREGCNAPWEHSNKKDIRVYSSEAAFRNDYGSSTSTTNAIRGVPYETLHFSFEKEVSNVKMPLNTLLHLKSDYSGYKVKEFGIGDGEDDAVSIEYTDPNKEVALTNLAALLIEPITN